MSHDTFIWSKNRYKDNWRESESYLHPPFSMHPWSNRVYVHSCTYTTQQTNNSPSVITTTLHPPFHPSCVVLRCYFWHVEPRAPSERHKAKVRRHTISHTAQRFHGNSSASSRGEDTHAAARREEEVSPINRGNNCLICSHNTHISHHSAVWCWED